MQAALRETLRQADDFLLVLTTIVPLRTADKRMQYFAVLTA